MLVADAANDLSAWVVLEGSSRWHHTPQNTLDQLGIAQFRRSRWGHNSGSPTGAGSVSRRSAGIVEYANERHLEQVGLPREAVLGRPFDQLQAPAVTAEQSREIWGQPAGVTQNQPCGRIARRHAALCLFRQHDSGHTLRSRTDAQAGRRDPHRLARRHARTGRMRRHGSAHALAAQSPRSPNGICDLLRYARTGFRRTAG